MKKRNLFRLLVPIVMLVIGIEMTACNTTSTGQKNSTFTQPNLLAGHYNSQLGLAYLQKGDRLLAKQKLLLALQQAPNSAEVQDAMAYFLEISGDTAQAQIHYLRAIQCAPDKGAALNNYGVFLCRTGQYDLGKQQFLAAVQDTQYLNTAEAYENAGLCAQAKPDEEKALRYFQQAIIKDPHRVNAWLGLAQISYDQHHPQLAQQYYDEYKTLTRLSNNGDQNESTRMNEQN
jgi:type IV pilus assembly protein PilF